MVALGISAKKRCFRSEHMLGGKEVSLVTTGHHNAGGGDVKMPAGDTGTS